ncbi:hypothetical protein Pla52n_53830 [Stieleria varia]|uniref:Methyltransferase domain-containing protein n=2 Tax=Stieleria varia TaxID=2528005 RepID=A0A5C6A3T4_9BACT|nr:hypothetical protein Pla52n_53830 [Stieleria varia]
MFFSDLSQRSTETELMDSRDSDVGQLFNTLGLFPTINRWLTPCHRLINHYILSAMKSDRHRRWTLLDIGAGGGDLARWLSDRCHRLGIHLDVTCLDHDPRVIEFARQKCDSYANIEVRHAKAQSLHGTDEQWDFVFANHFLHHLHDEELSPVLSKIARVTKHRFVLSDIHRTGLTYLAFSSLLPLRWTRSFVYHDGRTSIRRAFTVAECHQMLAAAGMNGSVKVRRYLPGHLAMIGNVAGLGE